MNLVEIIFAVLAGLVLLIGGTLVTIIVLLALGAKDNNSNS